MSESPIITGVIGVSERPVSKPSRVSSALKRRVLAHSRSRSSGSSYITRIASRQAAATAGGCEVENRNGRARWVRSSRRPVDAGDVAAEDADRLRQRADLDGHAAMQPEVVDGAPPVAAEHARGVGVVDHHGRAERLGRLDDPGQRRDVAVHREDAVGHDEDEAVLAVAAPGPSAAPREDLAQRGHVTVRVDLSRRLRQAHAVDDRGVVERVRHDQVRSRR